MTRLAGCEQEWWRGAVIYQIYPRSFYDSNGDGVGDLAGILAKLDYVAALGVDGIWISPFFKSPMKDFGYDISDYRAVDPLFGNLDDFDRVIEGAHARGLKVLIDQVLSHTSDEHAWFLESRASRDNARADWYVWADPKPDGTPPNNWLSIFGGSAWEWEPRREQYYLHNFLKSQPDLNYHCPAVIEALLADVEFWLARGVDGLRLDAIHMSYHDKALRNNPPMPLAQRTGRGFSTDNPYAYQSHLYDNTQPETLGFLEQIRALLDRYPGRVSLGEIGAEDSFQALADYTQGHSRLHMAYSFELMSETLSGRIIRRTVEQIEAKIGDGWACMALGNHDVVRVMTRWGGANPSAALARTLNALVLSLRGSVCIYQGEELGLTEAELTFADLQDPYGIAFWPRFKGRDGCRTPQPWNANQPHAGFSRTKPWLPIPQQHLPLAVASQESRPDSVLTGFRQMLVWRREQPALRLGDIKFWLADENYVVFERRFRDECVLCAFNFSAIAVRIDLPQSQVFAALEGHGGATFAGACDYLLLPPETALFSRVQE